MARIRTIKPEFWSDEKLSECSLSARLLFIGLISFADDEGRLEYSPVRLRMQLFPCGTVKLRSLTEDIGALTERSLIRRYVSDGKEYLDIPNFGKHQKINRPTPSKLPAFGESSVSAHGVLSESSLPEGKGREGIMEWNGMEGKGREGRGMDLAPPRHISEFDPQTITGLNPDAWQRWLDYRAQRKPAIKPESRQEAAEQLAAFGADQLAVVKQSIAAGWQGLFALKTVSSLGAGSKPYRAPPTVAELEEREKIANAGN